MNKDFDHCVEIRPSEEFTKVHGFIFNSGSYDIHVEIETAAGDVVEGILIKTGEISPIRVRRILRTKELAGHMCLVWNSKDPDSAESVALKTAQANPLPKQKSSIDKAHDALLGVKEPPKKIPSMHLTR